MTLTQVIKQPKGRPVLSKPIWVALLVSAGLAMWQFYSSSDDVVQDLLQKPQATTQAMHQSRRSGVLAKNQPLGQSAPRKTHWPQDIAQHQAWPHLPSNTRQFGATTRNTKAEPARAVAEAAQTAPSFPYQWVGRWDVDGQMRAVVIGPHHTWVLARGDSVDKQWQVETLSAQSLVVRYLPLNQTQSLSLK